MHVQDSHGPARAAQTVGAVSAPAGMGAVGTMTGAPAGAGGAGSGAAGAAVAGMGGPLAGAASGAAGAARPAPLRVDAQRNLEHVLRAAREVFGELGYGAPMEDVARRARVGVGTVYRRFPSKDVLVRRIAQEETARLTDQARAALGQEDEPWSALARFLRTSVASGAGRLLPPQVLRVGVDVEEVPAADDARVPRQRGAVPSGSPRTVAPRGVPAAELDGAGVPELLDVVGRLVGRAREAGELRRDVTVGDVLLVIATAAPSLPDAAQQSAASARLLDILLEGLRSRP
ncbi:MULTISPECIES: TetR/AcrR family transcriptional regulator [Streptomyces]|uniref:Bacterial regulatory protein, tetR family n=3 Tax=Streptomyces TaxID=1883 RepID=A0A1D8G2S3_9ACTN|nr:Bacterial regulatory protein, tetR family [Streptomyces rubrolavendulae]OSY51532.1 Bacterial regulatory protein, tetR family [Streptomyces fradiae ATCC 10745 = DSM 40063]